MNPLEKYYAERLYPLQDGVIKIVTDLELPFYLTGGTALSRYYLNHRYSDDLDFFINSDPAFRTYIKSFLNYFSRSTTEKTIKLLTERTSISDDYAQFFVYIDKTELKLDFVNDIAIRFESIVKDKKLGKVDSLRNILSNKISALYRFELKDYADIWCIAKNYQFNWRQIINEAKQKEASVDPIDIVGLFKDFPIDSLDKIKWILPIDIIQVKKEFQLIAEDILNGSDNSLMR